jgi:hypothetical protein
VAVIKCPGCGASIDTEKQIAEFRSEPPREEPGESSAAPQPAPATPRRGNAFFKPRNKE